MVAIVISGGTYVSETDGSTQDGPASGVTALLSSATTGATGVAVTPLSDMANAYALAHAAASGISTTSITAADAKISTIFGLTSAPARIIPDFSIAAISGVATDSGKMALAVAALEGLATKLASGVTGINRSDVYAALSADMSMGTPGASAVTITSTNGTTKPLPNTTLGNDLAKALASVNPTLFSGAASAVATAISTTAATVGTTVTGNIPKSVLSATGVSSSSSGAMSYTSIAGHQYLYIAARYKGVRKVDVTDPASAVEVTAPAWNGAALASNAGFSSKPIGGATVVSGSNGVQILVFAYGAKHIVLLDPDTGAITYEGNLPLTGGIQTFSGGDAYIAGAIPDPGKGVWLATTDGYLYLDINATLAAGTGASPVIGSTKFAAGAVSCCSGGSPNQLAENLGGDIAHNLLFTPNYGGLSLQIVADQPGGLAAGTYMLDPSARPSILSGNMDGGAVDTGYGVGIITYEDTRNASFINLNGITASAVPTGTTMGTFLPPATNSFVDVNIASFSLQFSGSAVDSKTHQVFGMAGFSNDIFVGQLQDPGSVSSGSSWAGMSDWVYYTLSSYSYAKDPHANITVFNEKTGKTYAYLLDGYALPSGVQQIDVSALMAMPRSGTTGDALHHPATNPQASGGPIIKIPLH